MKDFKLITDTMTKMGMSDSEKEAIFGLVAAVMHLGNILFEENHDDSKGGNNPIFYVVPPRLSLLCDVILVLHCNHLILPGHYSSCCCCYCDSLHHLTLFIYFTSTSPLLIDVWFLLFFNLFFNLLLNSFNSVFKHFNKIQWNNFLIVNGNLFMYQNNIMSIECH